MKSDDLVVRQPVRLLADPRRVIAKLFVPGRPDDDNGHHVGDVVGHVLDLDDEAVARGLGELVERFGHRHRDLLATFEHHASRIANRIPAGRPLTTDRRLLLGATFTHEYSVEAAALCNPSLVLAPDQSSGTPRSVDMVMSTRGIGEGHRSSVGFRSVRVDEDGRVTVPPRPAFASAGVVSGSTLHSETFGGMARRLDEIEARTYRVSFPSNVPLDERILYPATAFESSGIEDARFVRFEDDDGPRYYATYTAYDGTNIAQQLLETTDFSTFEISPLQGLASRNKGLALFPRRIAGRFAALTRHDGATNAVAFADDVRYWPDAEPLVTRPALWSAIQVGNCGSPIETGDGWIVLTHGVGPMRSYSIGACLLDLEDPTRVVAELACPLLSPAADEQDGYVPNVVYSCGAARHGEHLVIPYGIGDAAIGFASVSIDTLLGAMNST